jgi:hypothetical protein
MVSLPTVNARCTVRTPTVTNWLTSSMMQIWGAHFLGPEGQVNTSGRVTHCERPSGDLTLQVHHMEGGGWPSERPTDV